MQAKLAAAAGQYLIDTATIYAQSDEKDAAGAQSSTRQPVLTTPCRLLSAGKSNQAAVVEAARQETMSEIYRMIVPASVILEVNQRVVVNGGTFEITRIEDKWSNPLFKTALLEARHE
jgi:hypothetical protein